MGEDWDVTFNHQAAKQLRKLPVREQTIFGHLLRDLRASGPVVPHWKNYSKLSYDTYHCHLTYRWVACWKIEEKKLKIIEIYYLGSRENAPY